MHDDRAAPEPAAEAAGLGGPLAERAPRRAPYAPARDDPGGAGPGQALPADPGRPLQAAGRRGQGGRRHLLRPHPGETLGIVGESGCGKSTVAKLADQPGAATAGSILYKGEDITRLSGRALKAVRRNIQMVFQDPYTSLNPRMTVGDIIGEPFDIHPEVAPKGDRRRKVQELLDVVGLNPEYINRYPHQFCGGQRQRIGIARGLALRPEVIVATSRSRRWTSRCRRRSST